MVKINGDITQIPQRGQESFWNLATMLATEPTKRFLPPTPRAVPYLETSQFVLAFRAQRRWREELPSSFCLFSCMNANGPHKPPRGVFQHVPSLYHLLFPSLSAKKERKERKKKESSFPPRFLPSITLPFLLHYTKNSQKDFLPTLSQKGPKKLTQKVSGYGIKSAYRGPLPR